MKKHVLYSVLMFWAFANFAQGAVGDGDKEQFFFRKVKIEPVETDATMIGSHYLGDEIAKKYYTFKETYTYIEKGTQLSPGDKIRVEKPVIFYSINKLNRQYKKDLKKGNITEDAAKDKLTGYFETSVIIFDQNTQKLEDELNEAKTPEEIEGVLDRIVLE